MRLQVLGKKYKSFNKEVLSPIFNAKRRGEEASAPFLVI
jgi:hypothetical protein